MRFEIYDRLRGPWCYSRECRRKGTIFKCPAPRTALPVPSWSFVTSFSRPMNRGSKVVDQRSSQPAPSDSNHTGSATQQGQAALSARSLISQPPALQPQAGGSFWTEARVVRDTARVVRDTALSGHSACMFGERRRGSSLDAPLLRRSDLDLRLPPPSRGVDTTWGVERCFRASRS